MDKLISSSEVREMKVHAVFANQIFDISSLMNPDSISLGLFKNSIYTIPRDDEEKTKEWFHHIVNFPFKNEALNLNTDFIKKYKPIQDSKSKSKNILPKKRHKRPHDPHNSEEKKSKKHQKKKPHFSDSPEQAHKSPSNQKPPKPSPENKRKLIEPRESKLSISRLKSKLEKKWESFLSTFNLEKQLSLSRCQNQGPNAQKYWAQILNLFKNGLFYTSTITNTQDSLQTHFSHLAIITFQISPDQNTLLVLSNQFSLFFYSFTQRKWNPNVLFHPLHINAVKVLFKPCASNYLAICGEKGLLIWKAKINSLSRMERMDFCKEESKEPLDNEETVCWNIWKIKKNCAYSDMSWSNNGEYLALSSIYHHAIFIYDFFNDAFINVYKYASTVRAVNWSPLDNFLISQANEGFFRIYETKNFSNDEYSNLTGLIQTSFWSQNEKNFFFLAENSNLLYFVTKRLLNQNFRNPHFHENSFKLVEILFDLTFHQDYFVEHIEINSENSLLAVMLMNKYLKEGKFTEQMKEEGEIETIIFLFNCEVNSEQSHNFIEPIGWINNSEDQFPLLIRFDYDQNVRKDILYIYWSNHQMSFFTCV
jgi:hypothetical protein